MCYIFRRFLKVVYKQSKQPLGLREFVDNRQMKVARLSALRTGHLYPPENNPVRVKSMQNSSDPTGNRTRDLPPCSALPEPSAPAQLSENCFWQRNEDNIWLGAVYCVLVTVD
jgi:hypothetical protein